MTRTEIIALARQAGIDWTDDVFFVVNAPEMERFAQLLVESTLEKNNLTWVANCQHLVTAEREECAQIVEREASQYAEPVWAVEIVNDIRARSN